jgi:hypothetical protein
MNAELKYYKLESLWNELFSNEELIIIDETYKPFSIGTSPSSSDETITSSTQTRFAFLSGLISWFKNPEHYSIGIKLIKAAESFKPECKDIIDLHFYYQNLIQFYYRNRDLQPDALELSIQACKNQIAISKEAAEEFNKESKKNGTESMLPIHVGYKQLAIIYDKKENWEEMISVCKMAKSQNWNDDWDKRIEKAIKKRALAK